MSNRKLLLLGIVLIIVEIGIAADFSLIGSAAASDVPFVFEGSSNVASYTSTQIEQASATSSDLDGVPMLSTPSDSEILEFPVTGGGGAPAGMAENKVAYFKRIFDVRVEPGAPLVHKEALELAAKHPGDYTIEQVSTIYSYLKERWHYVRDPRGVDYYNYANESLNIGKDTECAGAGDCDDFAILMSALIESIGGTTRIILASNNTTGGHAYAEVYVGKLNDTNSQVNEVINWLKQKFETDKIYTHIDTETKDIWLNLDWGTGEKGYSYPGGPFFKGSKHILISIRDEYVKTSIRLPDGFATNKPKVEVTEPTKLKEVPPLNQGKNYQREIQPSNVSYSESGGVDSLIDKGIVKNNEGYFDEAVGLYDQALNLDPGNYLAWELKGLALRGLGKYDEALSCFDKAISIDSNRDGAWKDKGETFYIMGQYQEAVNCFDKAIQIRPCGGYWDQKGEALIAMGRQDLASDALSQAQAGTKC